MKKPFVLTVIFVFMNNCGGTSTPKPNVVASTTLIKSASPSAAPSNETKTTAKIEKSAPAEFRNVDFKNFSYPITWKHQTVRLKNGRVEFFEDKIFNNGWFDLAGVDYADLDGDGRTEAVVQLHWVSCGGSCDGGSSLFYFYELHSGMPRLLTRIETGSLAYQECGLKTFKVHNQKIVLETFQVCRFNGNAVKSTRKSAGEGPIGKFRANSYTRFTLLFRGSSFALQNRQVFPWPEKDVKSYEPEVSIN